MDIQKMNRICFILMTFCFVADFCIGAAIQDPDILANDQNDPQLTSSVPEEDSLTVGKEDQGDIIITTVSENTEAILAEDESPATTTLIPTEDEISDLRTKSDVTRVISDASIGLDHSDYETEGSSSSSSSQAPRPPKPSRKPDHKNPSSGSSGLAFGHIFLSLFAVLFSSLLLKM